ncbi:MAG: hypothetical protein ACLSHU_06830 [Oscillospiraceae bacterium]
MENEIFAKTVSTKSIQVGGRSLTNHNKLLYAEGADGVSDRLCSRRQAGFIPAPARDGRQLIAVTINAPDDWNDHARLLDYGFGQFETKRLVQAGQCLGTVEVLSGEGGSADLAAGEDPPTHPVARGETLEVQFPGPGFAYAPVTAGQEAGTAHVLLEGVPVGKVPVVWGETIAAPTEPEGAQLAGTYLGR